MTGISLRRVKASKIVLMSVIAATSILPALFIDLDEATTSLNIYKLAAKTGSLVATPLFVWQFLTGFRQAAAYVTGDALWTVALHKKLGMAACLLIVLHPVFITLYYLEKEGINPLTLRVENSFDAYVVLGQVALVLIAIIAVTSAVFRKYMSFDAWYATHLVSYIVLPIALVHSFAIGPTIQNTAARTIWIIMTAILAAFYLFRILCRLMLFSRQYKVVHTEGVAPDTTEIALAPQGNPMQPGLGQFVYLRRGFWNIARPYTVSGFDGDTKALSITAKAMGRTSTALQSLPVGKETYLDGPYGVFTINILASERPVVMVAGGIGITPFRRVIKELQHEPARDFYLFYGNSDEGDITYKDELDRADNVKVVHVMSDQDDFDGERGYIDAALIRKYVKADLADHEFFICGPPAMTLKLEDDLHEQGVSPKHIHHELFSN